jgi:hypothetical protein
MTTNDNIDEINETLNEDDFVFTKNENGEIVGGGYKIDSFFLKGGISPMTTYNEEQQGGGNVSSLFENLAVPAGLFYVNMRTSNKQVNKDYKPHQTASDDIMDKLYSLVEIDKKRKRKTKKHLTNSNKHLNKSRKQKIHL